MSPNSVTLLSGNIYRFYQQDSSNSNHPFKFSTNYQALVMSGSNIHHWCYNVGTPGDTGTYTK